MAKNRGRRIDSIAALDMETMRPLFGFGAQHFGPIAKLMGVRYPSVASNTFIGPLPASAAETIVLTTPPLTLPLDGATILLFASANIVTGATTTALVGRIRRGTTVAGALVSINPFTVTAGAAVGASMPIFYFDTPGAVAGQQYTLTISQTAATGAGIWQDGALLAFAL